MALEATGSVDAPVGHIARTIPLMPLSPPGGPVGGLVVASMTSGTLEDLLVMTIGGLAAYVSVINLPLRWEDRRGGQKTWE